MLPAIGVQPRLQRALRHPAAAPRSLQRTMEPFHFPLRLRMPYPAPAQANPLTHQPQRELGSPRRRLLTPSRDTVVESAGAVGENQALAVVDASGDSLVLERDTASANARESGTVPWFAAASVAPPRGAAALSATVAGRLSLGA